MNCVSSDGCIGSWCWSWPTSSLRKSSLPISPLFLVATAMPSVPTGAVVVMSVGVMSLIGSALLGQHVHQHATRQLEGRLHGQLGDVAGIAGRVRAAAALAAAALTVLGAGAACGALVSGRLADVEAEQVHALALEL